MFLEKGFEWAYQQWYKLFSLCQAFLSMWKKKADGRSQKLINWLTLTLNISILFPRAIGGGLDIILPREPFLECVTTRLQMSHTMYSL